MVDLPEPAGPTIPTLLPRRTEKFILLRIVQLGLKLEISMKYIFSNVPIIRTLFCKSIPHLWCKCFQYSPQESIRQLYPGQFLVFSKSLISFQWKFFTISKLHLDIEEYPTSCRESFLKVKDEHETYSQDCQRCCHHNDDPELISILNKAKSHLKLPENVFFQVFVHMNPGVVCNNLVLIKVKFSSSVEASTTR